MLLRRIKVYEAELLCVGERAAERAIGGGEPSSKRRRTEDPMEESAEDLLSQEQEQIAEQDSQVENEMLAAASCV